jgi:6-hydroxycyclohex-1-ene-1-carbonyl-CoA dehydrogenase
MSGTPAGQISAFGLLDYGAYLAVVGFTPKAIEIRLSNLMAFDATAHGNWGCPPDQYPAAMQLVLEGKVSLAPFVEFHALEEAPAVLEAVANHSIRRRVILQPKRGQRSHSSEAAR